MFGGQWFQQNERSDYTSHKWIKYHSVSSMVGIFFFTSWWMSWITRSFRCLPKIHVSNISFLLLHLCLGAGSTVNCQVLRAFDTCMAIKLYISLVSFFQLLIGWVFMHSRSDHSASLEIINVTEKLVIRLLVLQWPFFCVVGRNFLLLVSSHFSLQVLACILSVVDDTKLIAKVSSRISEALVF